MATDNNADGTRTDERRGIHLLSPGDVVRFGPLVMNVQAVNLAAYHQFSTVLMVLPEAMEPIIMPLIVVEEACEVFLRAVRPQP